jgi:hypothetical protein
MKFGEKIKFIILKIQWVVLTSLQLHSKSPTKKIKKNWEIFAIGVMFIFFMNLFCGMPVFLTFKIEFPFSNILNQYGSFIFWFFTILFMIAFLKVNKKTKKHKNDSKPYIAKATD